MDPSLKNVSEAVALLDEPIVAVSTAAGRGAIGIVRLSGEGARVDSILGRVLSPAQAARADRTARLVTLLAPDTEEPIDRGLILRFRAPNSYTGEDLVEFHLHGSPAVLQWALEALQLAGARPAGPGEFTRRAVVNGRMDLLDAEGVDALVCSESRQAVRLAGRHLGGELRERLTAWKGRLLAVAASLEAAVDFPEELEPGDLENGLTTLPAVESQLVTLRDSFAAGRRIAEGLHVVLRGPVNAGKSTLFNALLGYDRTIVSSIPGTTRDLVSETVEIEGVRLHLQDTAGDRSTTDPIEAEGVSRAARAENYSDVTVTVRDARSIGRFDTQVPEVPVATHADLLEADRRLELRQAGWHVVCAPTDEGLPELRRALVSRADLATGSAPIIHTQRQYSAVDAAAAALAESRSHLPNELVLAAHSIREAGQRLQELLGDWDQEEVLDALFDTFCIGK